MYLLRLCKVECQHIQALVVQQLQLGGELLLLQADYSPICLNHMYEPPLTDHMLRGLHTKTCAASRLGVLLIDLHSTTSLSVTTLTMS